jgi:hypothetical protein
VKQRCQHTATIHRGNWGCFGGDVSWDVTPCSLVERYRCLGGMCCHDLQGRWVIILPKTCRQHIPTEGQLGRGHTKETGNRNAIAISENCYQPFPQFALLHSLTCVQRRLITILGNCDCVAVASFLGVPSTKLSHPEDGGSRLLRNVGTDLPNYMGSYPKRKRSLVVVFSLVELKYKVVNL